MMRRALWLIPLALLIALAGVAGFFAATETGLRLLWPRLTRALPGELAVESLEGRLIGPIALRGLRYRQDGTALTIERLEMNWRPTALLYGKLGITRLRADGVALQLPASAPDEAGRAAFTPPSLPLTLSVADARLGRVSVARADTEPTFIESAEFDFDLGPRALEIDSLAVHAGSLRLTARGRIALTGDIAPDLRTDWSLSLPGYAPIKGGGTIAGKLAELRLDQRLEAPASARLQALLRGWPAQPHWEARLEIDETDVRRINASWPELAVRAGAEGRGDFQDWRIEGNFHLRQEQPGPLNGAFTLRHTPEFWTLERLEIRAPAGAQLNATAQYPARGAMRSLKLDAEWRALAWPFTGTAAFASPWGRLHLAGTPERYTLRLETAITGAQLPPGEWSARGRGSLAHFDIERLEARLLDGRLTGQGRIAWSPELAWRLTLAGSALDPGRQWPGWPGRLAFQADTRGARQADRWQAEATIKQAGGQLRGQAFNARGALHIDGQNYRLGDFRLSIGAAQLRASGTLADRWDLRWEARADNLGALLPVRGAIAAQGSLTGTRAAPAIIATARVQDLALEQHRSARLNADIDLDIHAQTRGLQGRLTLTLPGGDRLEGRLLLPGLTALGGGVMKSQAIEGELSARLDRLEPLAAIYADVENTRGRVRVNLTLGGTLGEPRITGRATLADGAAQIPRLGLALKEIGLTAESDAQGRLRFEGRLRSGGELRFHGRMQWPAAGARDWLAELALKGERVEVVKTPEAWALASPDLRLRAQPPRVDVDGEVVIPEARVEPRQTSAAIPVSRDVVLLNAPDESAGKTRMWDLHSRVRVLLGDKVRFQGFGLSGNITGGVTATDEPGKITTAGGELKITDGKYKAYGRELEVERGRLIFAGGPIDNPGIDARALRRIGADVVAGISVRGTLKSPVLTLFSEPPMSQADVLSYLILGHPLHQASSAEGRTLAGAASALTITGGGLLARQIGARFGFEQVEIQAGDAPEEAALVVGRYLSPKLFVAYSVGLFEQINLLRLRYQLSSRWTVQTETGTYSGADLFFTIER